MSDQLTYSRRRDMTTPARNTRASSRRLQTPVPAPTPSVAGRGGSRRTPGPSVLPEVHTTQSHNYGTTGRAVVPALYAKGVENNAVDAFDATFDINRASRSRQGSMAPSEGRITRARGRAQRPPSPLPIVEGEQQDEESDGDDEQPDRQLQDTVQETAIVHETVQQTTTVDATVTDASNKADKSFGAVHETSPKRNTVRPQVEPRAVPWYITAIETAKRSFNDIAKYFFAIMLTLIAASFLAVAFYYLSPRIHQLPRPHLPQLHPVQSLKGFSDRLDFSSKVNSLNPYNWLSSGKDHYPLPSGFSDRIDELEMVQNAHKQSIRNLEQYLPSHIVIGRNPQTGAFEFKDDFWNALGAKIKQEKANLLGTDSPSAQSDWDSFVAKNGKQLEQLVFQKFDHRFSYYDRKDLNKNDIVDREAFIRQVKNELWDYLRTQVDMQILQAINHQGRADLRKILAANDKVATKAFNRQLQKLSFDTLEEWIRANQMKNLFYNLNQVNFMSAKGGAVVDPYLTSPTRKHDQTPAQRLYKAIFGLPEANPPIVALEKWEEMGDAWCAANNKYGHSQLAVLLPKQIYPRTLTVEHVPRNATYDIGTAPKKVEAWIQIPDAEIRRTVHEKAADFGTDCSTEESLFDKGFACVGSYTYQIDSLSYLQSFDIDVNLEQLNIPVNKVVVRVAQNWGRDWTCLYRLRMSGKVIPADDPQLQYAEKLAALRE